MTAQIFSLPDLFFDPEPAKAGIEAIHQLASLTNTPAMAPFGAATAAGSLAAFSPVPAFGFWLGLCKSSSRMMLEGFVCAPAAKPLNKAVAATPLEMPVAAKPVAKKAETSSKPAKIESVTAALDIVPPVERPVEGLAEDQVEAKPASLSGPRGGKGDDLKLISGVGPKIEGNLHELGIYHFDQIAQWTPAEVIWVDDHLRFSGRITRENWIAQAKALATGGHEEYVKVFGKEPV